MTIDDAPFPAMTSPTVSAGETALLGVLAEVAGHTHDAIVIARAAGREAPVVAFVNGAFSALTGWTHDEVVGQPFGTRAGGLAAAQMAGLTERLRGGERLAFDVDLHRSDGSTFPAAVRMLGTHAGGGEDWFVAIARDRTADDAAALLDDREAWAQGIIDAVDDIIFVADADTRVQWVSPSITRLLGYRPDEVVGVVGGDYVHPDDLSTAFAGWAHVIEKVNTFQPRRVRFRTADGSYRWMEAKATSRLDDPAIRGVIVTLTDAADQVAYETLLAEQASLLEAIAQGKPLEVTLQQIARMVERALPGSACAIGMLDDDGIIRVRACGPNLPRRVVQRLDELDPDSEACRELRRSQDRSFSYDLRRHELLGPAGLFEELGLGRADAVALRAAGTGELLGAMTVFHRPDRELDEAGWELVTRSVNLAAIAIERRVFESRLEFQAFYDPLTELPNRALLHVRVQQAIERSSRTASGVAVLFIDLDRFKVVNDSVGHAAGDRLLLQVKARLQATVRPGDTLGRFGGDSFLVVCNRIAEEAQATRLAEELMAAVSEPFELGGHDVFVTMSIGIALGHDPSATPEDLVRNADVAMYRAKDQGRNQYVVFQEQLDLRTVEKLALEQALRAAIDQEQFELHYQPVVGLLDGAVAKAEALVRWRRPGDGLELPGSFIPLAEENGLIVPLGWWILEEACRSIAAWPRLTDGSRIEIAVNLSARQLAAPDLVPVVASALERHGIAPGNLCFEVTESALVHDVAGARSTLQELKALGVRLAIDDFGTGYATLDYVRMFSMADYLKIDRSFVEGVDREGSHEAAIVSAAVALAHSFGFTTVAEGVETSSQADVLRELGCDLAQGYLFSPAIPLGEAVSLIRAPGIAS